MEYFNRYKDFLLEYLEPEAEPAEAEQPAEELKFKAFTAEFNDSFGYNRTKIEDDGYKPELAETLSEFKDFITTNKTDNTLPKIESVDIIARGSASWVNTNYPDTKDAGTFNYDNNQRLANDRGAALSKRVIADAKEYLKNAGYDTESINFVTKETTGTINNKESKIVLNKFIKDNFESNKKELVNQMAVAAGGKGKPPAPTTKVKFFKDDSDKLKTRPKYEEDPDSFEVFTLEESNADKIYELLSESPAYVTYTARLKNGENEIRTLYKNTAQTAYVKVVINAKAKEEEPVPVVEPEPAAVVEKGQKFNLKSIPFKKDSAVLASETEYQNLVNIIKDPKNKIKYVALIGHAEGDDELGKDVFDPKSRVRLTQSGPVKSNDAEEQKQLNKTQQAEEQKRAKLQDKAKKEKRKMIRLPNQTKKTYFTENVLADLRFILGKERAKVIAEKLYQDLPEWTAKAASEFKLITASLGTMKGAELTNQKIVQVYIETEDKVGSNSENLGLFPNGFIGNFAGKSEVKLMNDLHYNIKKFYAQYARKDKMYTTKINPTYAQMANPKNVAQSRIYHDFRSNF